MQDELTGVPFEIQLPLCSTWQDEAGELWFEGVASSTGVDRQQERMSCEAIRHMGLHRGLPLLSSHRSGRRRELGVIDECWADNEQFRVRGRLYSQVPDAWWLYERARSGHRYGLSVGGRVRKAHWEDGEGTGERVRVIDEVALDHIAVCQPGQAVNPDTYLRVMARAVGSAEDTYVGAAPEQTEGSRRHRGPAPGVLGRAARSLQRLWRDLFGAKGNEDGGTGLCGRETTGAGGVEQELAALSGGLAEVRQDLAALSAGVRGAEAECAPGPVGSMCSCLKSEVAARRQTQGIDGQEKQGGKASHIWKGVL